MLTLHDGRCCAIPMVAEIAAKLCEEVFSSVAGSDEDDWSEALRKFREDRRYIRRAIAACVVLPDEPELPGSLT